jgi:pimeloyl-ACP methyl ester carboxylesterase
MGAYRFAGRDGVELACRETGSGRPLVLLHGFMGTGSHMLSYGRAGGFAGQGYRVFGTEMTGAGSVCASCGARRPVAELTVYLRAPGTVVRCRSCDSVLMVFVEAYGRACVDLQGLAALG